MAKLIGAFLLVVSVAVQAAGDVGLVNDVAGKVTYVSGAIQAEAKPFMRVHEGDRFSVPTNGRVRVLYLQTGRQEAYAGPAAFVVGATAGKLERGAAPQVTQLPKDVSSSVGNSVELLAKLSNLGGYGVRGVPMLSAEDKARLDEARRTYSQLRAATDPADITPELYLYSVVEQYHLRGDMKELIAEMRRRQPDNPEVAAMARAFETP